MKTIVFAYSQLGYECLKYLIEMKEDIQTVFTHEDNPHEYIWFESVAELARKKGIPVIVSPDPNTPALIKSIQNIAPDTIFSFYYRQMIKPVILECAKYGAFNMHGSLLPKYRGRAPVNWAIIKGEKNIGATLHYMVKAPDAGDIVDQQEVLILPQDTAGKVMKKVTKAALRVLKRQLPLIKQGINPRVPQDHSQATYFGGRKPEDGIIDWHQTSEQIHNLVRGLLPYPQYPCAYFVKDDTIIKVAHSEVLENGENSNPGTFIKKTGRSMIVSCGQKGEERILIRPLKTK